MDDELFPSKDGEMLTSDIDYVDVWRVRTHLSHFILVFFHLSCVDVSTTVCCSWSAAGDGSSAGLREGEEHRCVQLQHPAAGEAPCSVQGPPCCQSGINNVLFSFLTTTAKRVTRP